MDKLMTIIKSSFISTMLVFGILGAIVAIGIIFSSPPLAAIAIAFISVYAAIFVLMSIFFIIKTIIDKRKRR